MQREKDKVKRALFLIAREDRLGQSDEKIAQACGVGWQTINRLRKGMNKRPPHAATVDAILRGLGDA